MPWVLIRGERRRRNRLQGGRLHLGTVADIVSEQVAGMRRNPHAMLAGSVTAGALWDASGPAMTFLFGGAVAVVALFGFLLIRHRPA